MFVGRLPVSLVRSLYWRWKLKARNLLVARNFRILSSGDISIDPSGRLRFGTRYFGFVDSRAGGLIRNRGQIVFDGPASVGAGSQWDVEPAGRIHVGADTYFAPFTRLVSTTSISVGSGCAIGWEVQIIDADFHSHGALADEFDADSGKSDGVCIGDRVWVGSRVSVMKGVRVADGCIIASGAVVTKSFLEENCLIAGVPARVVKRGIHWS